MTCDLQKFEHMTYAEYCDLRAALVAAQAFIDKWVGAETEWQETNGQFWKEKFEAAESANARLTAENEQIRRDHDMYKVSAEVMHKDLTRLTEQLAEANAETDKANKLIDELRHERNVLQKIGAERQDELNAATTRADAMAGALGEIRQAIYEDYVGCYGQFDHPALLEAIDAALGAAVGGGERLGGGGDA